MKVTILLWVLRKEFEVELLTTVSWERRIEVIAAFDKATARALAKLMEDVT